MTIAYTMPLAKGTHPRRDVLLAETKPKAGILQVRQKLSKRDLPKVHYADYALAAAISELAV